VNTIRHPHQETTQIIHSRKTQTKNITFHRSAYPKEIPQLNPCTTRWGEGGPLGGLASVCPTTKGSWMPLGEGRKRRQASFRPSDSSTPGLQLKLWY